VLFLHGTTKKRAEAILQSGPDANFREPNGSFADGFSLTPANGPFDVGHPHDYARHKAANFPNEGGPAVVLVELSVELADILIGPLGQICADKALNIGAEVRFEPGGGLEELRAAWPSLPCSVMLLDEDEP
jgi:hypothetical protein